MGDETGLRPKAGKQREEPPDRRTWFGHKQNWVERDEKKALGGYLEGPTLSTTAIISCLSRHVPLTGSETCLDYHQSTQ